MVFLEQEFTVHPVGQGLFYSGIVRVESRKDPVEPFKFVFDCGSNTAAAGTREAKLFNDSRLGKGASRLDLLVISHFDADHINKIGVLLKGGVKIDHLILPFSSIEERLFLVLRFLLLTRGKAISSFFIRFALDPIGTLSGNLDDASTVYLITEDPNGPSPTNNAPNTPEPARPEGDKRRFVFRFDTTPPDAGAALKRKFKVNRSQGPKKPIKEVHESVKGRLYFTEHSAQLMEFIFFRKKIASHEKALYEAIYDKFCKLYKIRKTMAAEVFTEKVVEILRGLRGGRKIKEEAYKKVISVLPDLSVAKKDAMDLNTTALAMLHLNLDVHPLLKKIRPEFEIYSELGAEIKLLQRFDGLNTSEVHLPNSGLGHWERYHPGWQAYGAFPNCLLTSDIALKDPVDVNAFYARYGAYWQCFWLFQVPHHGSKHNADRLLFSRLSQRARKFINYGICHWAVKYYKHPDPELLLELQAAGCGNELLAVNEHVGLKFLAYWKCWI